MSGKYTFGFVKSCSFLITVTATSCTYCLFIQCILLDLFQIGVKMISVASLADSCIPWASLFREYFPAIDLLLKCHVIELFEIYKQCCESGLR